ncbi:MAG TPA: cell division protein ZipA, partial [Pseudomonadales bacterium]|nr:cell division protein ZipA [Pseudomonadales bacterium]
MDLGLREWLLILGPVFIIIILVHGYIRMRASRNTLKMALDKSFMSSAGHDPDTDEDISMLRAELPNGGARVRQVPEQKALNLDEDVPVLMEPVQMGGQKPDARHQAQEIEAQPEEHLADRAAVQPPSVSKPKAGRPEHFVVLYVTAEGAPFEGQALLESLVELDMQFGEMDIFHRLDAAGEPIFSLVNAVEPGTFDLASMDRLETPAVSLFMRAHELDEPLRTFDQMVLVAQSLADELGGEVKDTSRSVMTPQTIAHCREEIRDY